jgi:hypothetical protein
MTSPWTWKGLGSLLTSLFSGTEIFGTMRTTGFPDKAFVEASCKVAADLVAVGTCGRVNVEHVPFGGTAEKIVRAAPCPVPADRPGASALLRH